ncbi:MAG TPA: MCE family protein [bacterium]|nr:MCE family protein [bacterium]
MAQRSSVKTLRVGVFIFLALTTMIVFVFTVGGGSTPFTKKARYRVFFKSTSGLYEGDPVLLTGVEVGNVSRIRFADRLDEKRIIVEIAVSKAVQDRIRQDTRARVGSASLIYGKVVEITMGSSHLPVIPPGGVIEADDARVIGAMLDTTNVVIQGLRSVISKLDEGEGLLGVLLNEPLAIQNTFHNLASATDRLSHILGRVERGDGPVGAMVSDSVDFHRTIGDLRDATEDLKAVTSNLRGTEGLMGRMINDPRYGREVTEDLKTALQALASIATKIDTGYGTAGQLVNDPSVYHGLQHVILGMEKSAMTRWLIRNRRQAGEREMEKIQADDHR